MPFMKIGIIVMTLVIVATIAGAGAFLMMNGGGDGKAVISETADEDGILSVGAESKIIDSLVEKKDSGSDDIEVKIDSDRTDEVKISSNLVKAVKENGASLSFDIRDVVVDIPSKVLKGLGDGDLMVSVKEGFVPEAFSDMNGRPVYDFTLRSGDSVVSSFSGNMDIAIPYKLRAGESSGDLYIAYLGDRIEEIGCTYKNGIISFGTNHFSSFAIACRQSQDPTPSGPDEPASTEVVKPREIQFTEPSQWSFVGGDSGSFGVTDSKTPISQNDMRMLWKVESEIDASATAWKTPSSCLCVDDRVYYYNGQESSFYCVEVDTGKTIAKASCPSKTVYNMAITYGDGKVFAVTSTGSTSILYAFDAITLKQLFLSVPVNGGETQGTVTYNDGKVFFGTYSGDYACFSSEDKDVTRSDEKVEPLWLLESKGWYNATPAFLDDYIVLVQRGFDDLGAFAYFMDADTGRIIDTLHFDREYSSSGATFYEGRVYIPLNRVADRTEMEPNENTPEKLAIRSYKVTSAGFDRSSEKYWESDDSYWKDNFKGSVWGGTQSIPVIWNDKIYIGGGGKTLGSNEPLWIIDIDKNGNMKSRAYLKDVCTKATPVISTAYSTKENGYAVYIYVMEYGHVYQGEAADSANGYADIFVIKDTKDKGTSVVMKIRPDPAQFCYQSFSISEKGYVLIRNDTTLFCYGIGSEYNAEDVKSAIDRFISMYDEGSVNYRDYQRIVSRYSGLSEQDKAKVGNYSQLESLCVNLTLKSASGDIVIKAPKGSIVDIPDVPVPENKVLTGWKNGNATWTSFNTTLQADTVLTPVYADVVIITLDPQNGGEKVEIKVAKNGIMSFVYDPSKDGYEFGGWFDGSSRYQPNETMMTKDVTLTARWLKVSMLKFDSDGGSYISDIYYGVYDKPLGVLPTSVKAGFTFKGWFYEGKQYMPSTVYKFENSITLKAKWEENAETSIDNGKGLSVTGKFPADSSLATSSSNKNGYTFRTINDECKKQTGTSQDCDCILVTLKGDGVNDKLLLTVKVKANSSYNGQDVKVFYYQNDVMITNGKVVDGYLEFEAYGYAISGGMQLTFGVQSGVMASGSW